jgi:DNA-binding transcriptional regulator YhcF (GntR family)
MYRVRLQENHPVSKVQQIVSAIAQDVEKGLLKRGEKLPSINQFSEQNAVARDTIEKAYKQLKSTGYVASSPSRGYFVVGKDQKKLKVLLVFNRLSSFKKIIYEALLETFGKRARVDLHIHHYDPRLLREILQANLGRYDYYIIMPHFFSTADPEEYLSVLRMIPSHQLVLLDKKEEALHGVRSVYQDFRNDIYEALNASAALLAKYKSISLVFPKDTHHPKGIIEGVAAFCKEKKLLFRQIDCLGGEVLKRATVYIVTEEEDLANLLKVVRNANLKLGQEIGIISFNETVFKELLDITVVSTDFVEMGRRTAQLILERKETTYKNHFQVIRRGSL